MRMIPAAIVILAAVQPGPPARADDASIIASDVTSRLWCYGALNETGRPELASRVADPVFRVTRRAIRSGDTLARELIDEVIAELVMTLTSQGRSWSDRISEDCIVLAFQTPL